MTEYPLERSIPDSDAGFKIGEAVGSSINVDVVGVKVTNRSGATGGAVGNSVRLTVGRVGGVQYCASARLST